MRGWLGRSTLAVAGAVVASCGVAVVEAVRASRVWSVPATEAALGDAGLVVPLASGVGIAVAASAMLIDPTRTWRARAAWADAGRARGRAAAAALVAAPAAIGWIVACAHAARATLARGGAPMAAGGAMAASSLAWAVVVGTAVTAVAHHAGRAMTQVDARAAALAGGTLALGFVAVGVAFGDVSGQGRTPLAILGVLARPELDLWPVVALSAVAAFAWLGERASREGRWLRVVLAMMLVAGAWLLPLHASRALSDHPDVARALERGAPLGRVALALARRATDRDHDGASPLFGGGDCDDSDPRRHPDALDIAGNGIDEDCSGHDLPLPPTRALAHAAASTPVPRDLNILLVTVDTLRIDLGFMGYDLPVSPNLDRLAARSTVFERAYAMASYTGKSVGPTMIGKYPSECVRDGAHFDAYGQDNVLLAERLRDAGFRTMGVASHWYFKPKYGLSQGMDVWDLSALPGESAGDMDASVTSDRITDAAIRLLSDGANVSHRFFLWTHYFDPHAHYVAHPGAPDFRTRTSGWAKPLYDGEVWFTDRHIGRLLDFVASQPWGERTAIVVTSDHGEAFDEHGMSWHGVDLWEPLVRVPLVVYVPGVKPHRILKKRSLVDLAPTILDLAGVPRPPPGELSGESTLAAVTSTDEIPIDERDVFLDMPVGPQVPQHRAIIYGDSPGTKLLHEGGTWYLLFDLANDPAEAANLAPRDRELLSRAIDAYDDKLSALRDLHTPAAPYESQ